MRFVLAFLLAWQLAAPAAAQDRVVSVTIDDLPFATAAPAGSLAQAGSATQALLAALSRNKVPADIFITGSLVEVEGEAPARRALLQAWADAGHRLHNHGYGHSRFSAMPAADYLADVRRGQAVVAELRRAGAGGVAYDGFFRAPYNDLGQTADDRKALLHVLAADGVRLAPFTVEHQDWLFDQAYQRALGRQDEALAKRIAAAYLAQLDAALAFAETLSGDTFQRHVPQVLLIHANRLNADYLDVMLAWLRARGYRFVTLQDALSDPAYASTDGYAGKWGFSWLHRWRMAMGLKNRLRDEPEAPDWVGAVAEGRE
ncbi:polysaccharide deacetylase family protein [Variovorax terrae]|uniref:Polysaccharide deacetylase family protein n=1 Tax=Variovorax terrae TaxID=2923278 RepID=A0A9X2AMX0_9BURK|nr:polysaccharide deacetylase family protein [Variovorax terrae]MCJ0764193.1 polysaccharide deacetylase family protein [Variovorax terrae]